MSFTRQLDNKHYEMTNHLGNVLATVTDRKLPLDLDTDPTTIDAFDPVFSSAHSYYPFGMIQPNAQNLVSAGYRFGFNGMEMDDEVKGGGNSLDFGARIYDPRVGKWLSGDPLESKYPSWSTYNFTLDNPLYFVDETGEGAEVSKILDDQGNVSAIQVTATIYIYSDVVAASDLKLHAQNFELSIEDQWSNISTMNYRGKKVPIVFDVNVQSVGISEAQDLAERNGNDKSVNFILITEQGGSGVRGNSGIIDLTQYEKRNGTTLQHEFGHLLGFRRVKDVRDEVIEKGIKDNTHFPAKVEDMGKTIPIMTGGEDSDLEAITDENLANRKVTNADVKGINFRKGLPLSTSGKPNKFGEKNTNTLYNTGDLLPGD